MRATDRYAGRQSQRARGFQFNIIHRLRSVSTQRSARAADLYGGRTTLYLGGEWGNFVLLPIIPSKAGRLRKPQGARNAR
jgi:hypothetical protein